MYADEPDIVADKFDELAYPDQPMGRNFGTAEIIKSISRDDVEGFMKGSITQKNGV